MALKVAQAKLANQMAEEQRERDQENRDEAFRQRVAIQQFMNSNGPIFRAFANRGVLASDFMRTGVLDALIANAVTLATATAARLYQIEMTEVTAQQARPFRVSAAEWVAAHWTGGKKLDVDLAAEQIAAAASLADEKWDHDVFRDTGVSNEGSRQATAAAVAGNLFESVTAYSFRLDPKVVVFTIVNAVVTEASKSAHNMLPNGSDADVTNLMQTIARNLSNLMQACYNQTARAVVKDLYRKPEQEKIAYLEERKPFDAVMSNFYNWAEWLAWISPQAAASMTRPAKENEAKSEMSPD